ncbi:Protoporphyrinogen IX oxidase, menaquinone-dependent (flavodoxin domain) [Fibrobacter sp. UWB15]|uniref:flavodoxin domain-containing protein n=1 Tax=unclassified Fibrobacter TaxID=2634177 RepID=UPI00091C4C25|nr:MULTISPECIES: flavodoxin domain-containing protein [unclassified Fibrobacter]PWJ64110.1 menaquinone-dependent protoporphyrinogen IX oxidase [Fibrobacter sp. UWB6]SHG21211.1 Protoporphyrinogen IX oxidase, menaquinone-dependent (flavodoxin domain) [Fibrobacter sp. UWB8]SMG29114.1 Protoporphyrinogen IX oxidase, menaquinone-dependent (flavodoxin domain) [Fibrobacter sp. UWB15]
MNTIIIYGSRYGSTKRYAERLAEITGLKAVFFKDVKSVAGYDRIVYLGALCAGGIMGLKKTVCGLSASQELFVATVGLADPTDAENVYHIRGCLKKQVPTSHYDESKIFHLRGAIDYTRLSLKHRIMMKLLYSKVTKIPEAERNAEVRALIATYGKQVDFVNFDTLEPIAQILK